MIQHLSIRNYKSIHELDLDCKRVNVFIGEPNTGKTNVLEALGLWCGPVMKRIAEITRSQLIADLFWQQDVANAIEVALDARELAITGTTMGALLQIGEADLRPQDICQLNSDLSVARVAASTDFLRFYLFNSNVLPDEAFGSFLQPPFGQNLASLLYSSKQARSTAAAFFEATGYKLQVDLGERRIRVTRSIDDILLSIPYSSVSETLRRMVFYTLALETNRDAVLVLDEPEAHAFPPYTKTLAERIALDDQGNQFFLTTHSPYMLDALLSKTPAAELNLVLCRLEDFETKAYPLDQEQIDQIKDWSMDAFFNFDRLLPEVVA